MSAVRNVSLSDPLSLHGLEPLLDQIFAVQYDFVPDDSEQKLTATRREVDFDAADISGDEWFDDLLRKQLSYAIQELKSYQYKCRWLELKLATSADQLTYMPELFSKALTHASMEAENVELKRENELLLQTIENMKPKIEQPSMLRRIANRFLGC